MINADSHVTLPPVPASLTADPVAAWSEPLVIDTYAADPPDDYPAYLDRRVYQGSSGRVYPQPFYDRVSSTKAPQSWEALHLENEYVRLTVLPELGGRIYCAIDKTRDYDFFYKNNVIKPALVGVLGPWISGGVEFNWPQHHRPGTYLPTEWSIEEEADGSRTIWCADLDPFARMKGMHGIRLRPGSTVIEARVRLFNRTAEVQTFLWWANVAARANDDYQSFFPTDVHFVADHAKRAVTAFPASNGDYYGINYPDLVTQDNPDGDRIDWYRNIPVPTSYMCLGSSDDFFGGYDHGIGAGFVHCADHRVSPGKKQWTWGNDPFGWAWDRNLTDSDGPYVELMAGVYTDNQPDFTFLLPGETKTFSQFWYPIQGIGAAHQASLDGAIHLSLEGDTAALNFVPTTAGDLHLSLTLDGDEIWADALRAAPGDPVLRQVELPLPGALTSLKATVRRGDEVLLEWQPRPTPESVDLPDPAAEQPAPAEIDSIDELYLTGAHLEQYRHATRSPEPYWEEALRRDPGDTRTNTAMGARRYHDGRLDEAEAHLTSAITRLVRLNPNPRDGEAHYLLGLVKLAKGDLLAADNAFSKAGWNAAWKAPSELALARIAANFGDWGEAIRRADEVLALDTRNNQARAIRVIGLRKLGRDGEATEALAAALAQDRLDWWLRALDGDTAVEAAALIDVALEFASLGCLPEAIAILDIAEQRERTARVVGMSNNLPLIRLHRADLNARGGDRAAAERELAAVAAEGHRGCFPGRLEDALMLGRVRAAQPEHAGAAALLGHWLYAHNRADDAIAAWSVATEDPISLRNRGVAAFSHQHDRGLALECYDKALQLSPADSRLWFERDQLAKQLGESLAERLARLEGARAQVVSRDDLTVEFANLLIGVGRLDDALELLTGHEFHPWEGGEGRALGAWEDANLGLARGALTDGDTTAALRFVEAAWQPLVTLGEDRHPLANTAHLDLATGDVQTALGNQAAAVAAWERAAAVRGDWVSMSTTEFSERSVCSVHALQRLGRSQEADDLARAMLAWAAELREVPATIDYFATSLPTMLLFHEDLQTRRQLTCDTITVQAHLALGELGAATSLADAVLAVDPAEPFAREVLAAVRA